MYGRLKYILLLFLFHQRDKITLYGISEESYAGCYNTQLSNYQMTTAGSNIEACRFSCQNFSTKYAVMSGSSCYCGNMLNVSASINNDNCNAPCNGSIANGFCGGTNGSQSFYFVWTIECSTPDLNDSFNNYTGINGYDSVFYFACKSGYKFRFGDVPYTTLRCNESGLWAAHVHELFDFRCYVEESYAGCYNSQLNNYQPTTAGSNIEACRMSCQNFSSKYAVMSGSFCYCGNMLNVSASINNDNCSAPCNGSMANGFCGGTNGSQSIYFVWSGCYTKLSVNTSSVKPINVKRKITCKQYCLGNGNVYAILDIVTSTCTCTDLINNDADFKGTNFCATDEYKPADFEIAASMVYNTGSVTNRYDNCDALYLAGIRLNGYYQLHNNNIPTFCTFKDGTTCDDNWVGYNDFCYLFVGQPQSFQEAQGQCAALNSTLVSVLQQGESDFINEYLKVYEHDRKNETWYIGLYRIIEDGPFSWTDGNLLQYTYFDSREPSSDDCMVLEKDEWFSHDCTRNASVICKKSVNYRCIESNITEVGALTSTGEDMTLTFCTQICKGQFKEYALVQNRTCWCRDNLPSDRKNASHDQCNTVCPGNEGQTCGGHTSVTAINVAGYKGAQSCNELELLGIGGSEFYTTGTSSVKNCSVSACPRSWIRGNAKSTCYRFVPGRLHFDEAVVHCSKYNAYVACLTESEERTFISSIVSNTEQFSNVPYWTTGLYSFQPTKRYRWFNGHQSIDNITVESIPSFTHLHISLTKAGTYIGHSERNEEVSFICEQNTDYIGCHQTNGSEVTHQLAVYEHSDVILCLEFCRQKGSSYLMVGKSYQCACSNTIGSKVDGHNCNNICPVGQPCGGEGDFVSVYNISMYPAYSSCEDLFRAGITLSGQYKLSSGNQDCLFQDSETICKEKWIGVNGRCFIGEIVDPEEELYTMTETCRKIGGQLATIYDQEYHTILYDYVANSPWLGLQEITRIGLLNIFSLYTSTWASGEVTDYFPYLENENSQYFHMSLEKYDHHDKILSGTELTSTSSNLLCEEMKDNVGCYDGKILNKIPIYINLMELTLCKQLCIANDTTFAGIRDDACFCLKENDLGFMTKLSSGNCSTRCPGNFLQYCGSGNNINVYDIANSTLAQSCEQLYSFGIFYNHTYNLNISGSQENAQCGFADETICEAGWYGYQGACFRFSFTAESYQAAAQVCINSNSFLVSPTMSSITFLNLLNNVPKYKRFDYYWTSLSNQFGNQKYLHGDGQRFSDVSLFDANGAFGHLVYLTWLNATNGFLTTEHESSSSPFVCQTSSRYIGCVEADSLVTTSVISHFSNSGMSASFCIQYCVGHNAEYAAITNKIDCKCYNDVINVIMSSDPCDICPGYSSQACGSIESIALYNVSFYMDIYESCDELLAYGITEPSWYYIKPHYVSKSFRVKCFDTGESFMPISTLPDLKSSTYMSNHDSSKSRLKWPYEEEDSWKPSTLNGSHYLTFKYPFDVIITGLVTQGNPLGKNHEWTRQFVFKYLDDALEQEITYSHEGNPVNFKGNTDRSSLKYNIFSNPIITREFTIQLTDWNNWPALRVQILGQPLSSYNYSQSIVKCYYVTDEIRKNTNSTPASTLDNCKVSCLQLDYPLCSFYKDNSTHCYCWNTLPSTYGTSENQTCNTDNRLLVYKTYDKLCPDPPTEYKATRNYTMPVPGLYTYKSTLTDTCIDGKFLDKNLTKSYTCLQDNKWSQDILMCEASCIQLQAPLNAKANSSEDSVHTVIAVTCDQYFMTSHNDTLQYVTCNETGMWDVALKHCDVHMCDETPTLLHASKYLKDSNTTEYICEPYYSFSNGSQSKIITCDGNSFKWENLNDICTRQDDLLCYRSMTSQFLGNTMRHTTNDVLLEFLSRSQMSCSSACLKDWHCKGYNYNDDVCRLFNSKSKSSADLTSDATWSYFEKSDEDLYPCN